MHDSGEVCQETKKPEMILDYIAIKGAVDTVDQMCGSYSVKRITRRWPLVIFFSIIDMAGINAFILYNSNAKNQAKNFPEEPSNHSHETFSCGKGKHYFTSAGYQSLSSKIQIK